MAVGKDRATMLKEYGRNRHLALAKEVVSYHDALKAGGLNPDLVELLVREWHHHQCAAGR